MSRNFALGKRFQFDNVYFSEPVNLGYIDLYQAGELYCEPGYSVEEHEQRAFEISYIVSGEGTFSTNGKKYHVKPNNIYINSKGELHSIEADRGSPLRYFYMAFDLNEKYLSEDLLEMREFYKKIAVPIVNDGKILLEPFNNVFHELYNKRKLSIEMIDAYLRQIIILTYRKYSEKVEIVNAPVISENSSGSVVYSVIRYVDENFRNITECKEISKKLGYSYTYLAHTFKKHMGITIGNYLIRKKLEEAKRLLKLGQMSITQISENLNYVSVHSFSNSFKKYTGISPSEYIKTQNNK